MNDFTPSIQQTETISRMLICDHPNLEYFTDSEGYIIIRVSPEEITDFDFIYCSDEQDQQNPRILG